MKPIDMKIRKAEGDLRVAISYLLRLAKEKEAENARDCQEDPASRS